MSEDQKHHEHEMRRARQYPLAFTIGLLVLGAFSGFADSPRLNTITPPGAMRGTNVEVRLAGQRLEKAREIVFYSPGISVTGLEQGKANSVKARLHIAPDCSLGEHQFRLRTASGITELRTFFVGPYRTLSEVEPNNELINAQKIPLNVTVQGAAANEDVDYFKVEAKKGTRISAEIEGMRLARGVFDPVLVVRDPSGKELEEVEDTTLLMQDAFVSFVAQEEGFYTIGVHDTAYNGAGTSEYRLHIGNFPRPLAVFPPGGRAGRTVPFSFLGDPQGEFTQKITLPDIAGERFGVFAEQDGLTSPSPNWIRISPFDDLNETEPNDQKETATRGANTLPVAFNGIIQKAGDVDHFAFLTHKGQALEITVFARRLRSPLDAVLEILDKQGAVLAANDDSTGPDSLLRWTVPADGEYFVRVKDQLGQGGLDYVYRVEVTLVQPTLAVTIPEAARNDTQTRQWIAVPRGNRYALLVNCKRANWAGDVRVAMEALPPGITLTADTLSSKLETLPVVFEAAPDAALSGRLVNLTAASSDSTKPVKGNYRHSLELVQGPNNTYYYATKVDKIYAAVIEALPFKVSIVEPKVPLVQGGTMDLKITVERQGGFAEPIALKMLWNPPGVGSQPEVVIPKGASSVVYPLNASAGAEAKTWKTCVLASSTINGGTAYASSQLVSLEVAPPFVIGRFEPLTGEPGRTVKMVCALEQKKPFEGKASVRLMGLPEQVTASERQISSADKEVVFDLVISSQAAPGYYRNIFCRAELRKNGGVIPHVLGTGGILRIMPPKASNQASAKSAISNLKRQP